MEINKIIGLALKEDIGKGDITTKILFPTLARGKAKIIAKENGVLCGTGVVEKVFRLLDKKIRVKKRVKEGEKIKKGKIICTIEGDARAILTGERVALNFLSRLSGIATLTKRFVEKVKPYKVKIMDTRKTTPGLRQLEKYAVKCGGGYNHRMGLWDQVLVKDNHMSVMRYASPSGRLRFASLLCVMHLKDLAEVVKRIKEGIKGIKKGMKIRIEVEVENLKQFKEVLKAQPDIIMLDNMKPSDIKKAVSLKNLLATSDWRPATKLEVSGGVTLNNVRAIAKTGVDMISIGALTHSARALDFSLEVTG